MKKKKKALLCLQDISAQKRTVAPVVKGHACSIKKNKQKNTHTKQKIQWFLSSLRTEEESSHIHASVGIHWWKPFVLKPFRVLHENKKELCWKIQGVCAVHFKPDLLSFVFFSLSEASFLCKFTFTDRFQFACVAKM